MKLISVNAFRKLFFLEGSEPDPRTVRNWVDTGTLPGRSIGSSYYVDVEAFEQPASENDSSPLLQALTRHN